MTDKKARDYRAGLPAKRSRRDWASHLKVRVPHQAPSPTEDALVVLIEVLSKVSDVHAPTGRAISLACEFEAILHLRYERLAEAESARLPVGYSGQSGLLLAGAVGMGKTRGMSLILRQFSESVPWPARSAISGPVIQVPYLYVSCPQFASLVDLWDTALLTVAPLIGLSLKDNAHYKRRRGNSLYSLFRSIATQHVLGVLVIDEIQNISAQKSQGAEAVKNQLVRLTQETGVPIVAIGTPSAVELVASTGRTARRFAERVQLWDPYEGHEAEWKLIKQAIWSCRAVDRGRAFTDRLAQSFHDASAGVPSFLQILLGDAQRQAFADGAEIDVERMVRTAPNHSVIGRYIVDIKRQRALGPEACTEPDVQLLKPRRKKNLAKS